MVSKPVKKLKKLKKLKEMPVDIRLLVAELTNIYNPLANRKKLGDIIVSIDD